MKEKIIQFFDEQKPKAVFVLFVPKKGKQIMLTTGLGAEGLLELAKGIKELAQIEKKNEPTTKNKRNNTK